MMESQLCWPCPKREQEGERGLLMFAGYLTRGGAIFTTASIGTCVTGVEGHTQAVRVEQQAGLSRDLVPYGMNILGAGPPPY